MPAELKLAETTIFIPDAVLPVVIDELKEAGLTILPHPASAFHRNKDGSVVGQMVDVLGPYHPLTQTLARTLAVNDLSQLNNPIFIFPFVTSE